MEPADETLDTYHPPARTITTTFPSADSKIKIFVHNDSAEERVFFERQQPERRQQIHLTTTNTDPKSLNKWLARPKSLKVMQTNITTVDKLSDKLRLSSLDSTRSWSSEAEPDTSQNQTNGSSDGGGRRRQFAESRHIRTFDEIEDDDEDEFFDTPAGRMKDEFDKLPPSALGGRGNSLTTNDGIGRFDNDDVDGIGGADPSRKRASFMSVATVFEEDLLDDRQGMNKSDTQFTQNEARHSFDGSINSECVRLGDIGGPGGGIGGGGRCAGSRSGSAPGAGHRNSGAHVRTGSSRRSKVSGASDLLSGRDDSRRGRQRRGNKSPRLAPKLFCGFFGGGGSTRRRGRVQPSRWRRKVKLRKRHETILNLQLSVMNCGLFSLRKLNRDLQSFLPKGRMSTKQFEERLRLMRKFEVLAMIEYKFASRYETYSCKHATLEANTPKNSYKKCIPYDYNRVVLKTLLNVQNSDYVNASHIDSYLKPNAYIAAQGPNENTVDDFWRMVWEQKSFVIVMLTKVFDFIKVMCNQYWPVEVNKPETYGNIEVTLLYEEPLADFVIRTIKLRKIRSNKTAAAADADLPKANGEVKYKATNDDDDDDEDEEDIINVDKLRHLQSQDASNRNVRAQMPSIRTPKFLETRPPPLSRASGMTHNAAGEAAPPSPGKQSLVAGSLASADGQDSICDNSSQRQRVRGSMSTGSVRSTLGQHQQQLTSASEAAAGRKQQLASSGNLFLHPLQNVTGGQQLFGSMTSVLSGSLSDLPVTPTTPMSPRTPSSAGLDRSSATRRAVKKKKRVARAKNQRPMRTQFLVPSESQLLDEDDDYEDEDDAVNDDNDTGDGLDESGAELEFESGDELKVGGNQFDFSKEISGSKKREHKNNNDNTGTTNNSRNTNNTRKSTAGAKKKKKNSRERIIYQFHYHSWASHTCPFISSLLHFRRRVRICMDEMSKSGKIGPTVVHCNDGCGRTGTYLCIDANLELAEEDNCYDVYNYTKKLRQSRKLLIENIEQYKFVYDTIEEAMLCGKTWFLVSELHQHLKYKSQRNPQTKTNEYQREYDKITRMTGKFSIGDCAGGHRVENRLKNRDVSTVPPDNFRPYLTSFQTNDNTDYINAVFVDGYTRSKEYIVTEWPLHRTISDFWSLIYDHDCNSVILLANPTESSKYPSFLPSEKELRRKFGPVFSAEMVSYTHYQNIKSWIYTINKRIVGLAEVMAGVKSEAKTTQVFQITCWPQGHRVPTSTNALVELMNMVERWRQRTTYGPVCVVSLDGKSRAGVYCAANVAIEQVVQHNEVDVFQAVKTVRRHRPQLIENMTEYKYCYDLILHYVLHYLKQGSESNK